MAVPGEKSHCGKKRKAERAKKGEKRKERERTN
jgi:hypothetical protein